MTVEVQPITSEQMYRIEDNGHTIFGMKKVLMMENAGHGLADFIVSEKGPTFAGKKIISFCGTGNNGGDAMVASRHLSSQSGVEVTIILVGDPENMKTEETLVNWSIVQKMRSIGILTGPNVIELAKNKISESTGIALQRPFIIVSPLEDFNFDLSFTASGHRRFNALFCEISVDWIACRLYDMRSLYVQFYVVHFIIGNTHNS